MSLSRLAHIVLIMLAVILALGLRLRAVNMLPIDYDEDDYLRAGQQFARAIQHGDWRSPSSWAEQARLFRGVRSLR